MKNRFRSNFRVWNIILFSILVVSCNKKQDVLLPKLTSTVVQHIDNYSSVYIFYTKKGNDTLVDVNRKNTISSTHWVFNIDKRFTVKHVLPEIIKLQQKKANSAHADSTSLNYFSYADIQHKNLAFVPFTKYTFHFSKPQSQRIVFIRKHEIRCNDSLMKSKDFERYLKIEKSKNIPISIVFSPSCTYETFLVYFVKLIESKSELIDNKVFIY